jgi:cellobiose phosphorylase
MRIFPIRWTAWLGRRPRVQGGELSLRAELFTVEQLIRHAHGLAAAHRIDTQLNANQLLDRLEENARSLCGFHRATLAATRHRRITPAAEWLLDNFYLIEEQVQLARLHLPRGYSRELPCLVEGTSAGLPRVYDIVLELIAHVDAQIDAGLLTAFIAAYQEVAPLKLGELWAIPIMLRLGLIENLQRITRRLAVARTDRDLADHWVNRLQAMAETNPSHLVVVVADMARADLPSSSSFVTEFCQRLSLHSPELHLARGWLEQRLGEQGLALEHLIQEESQSQAANQVSVSHSIASLRFLSALDWKEFVETLSGVESILRADPADVYSGMDFATRDRYRHAIESIARQSRIPEAEVAQRAIELAAVAANQNGRDDRTAHVGFYLIDDGLALLGRNVGVRWPWRIALGHHLQCWPLFYFTGGIGLLTLLVTVFWEQQTEVGSLPIGWLVGLVGFVAISASQLAVALINWLVTLLVKPGRLPRLDCSTGIPPDCCTMVVVPTMLTSAMEIDRLIERLEIQHLGNRDPNLHFALLTDFRDAAEQSMPADAEMLQQVKAGVQRLNRRYAGAGMGGFFLMHRSRQWSAGERRWMGYERKRGKLAEFNALLRGGPRDSFSTIVGETSLLPAVKYVITLDTDTQLPRETARQLVGTMAHRLNRPVFDPDRRIVTEGYGILQPRVSVSLSGSRRSWFARLFAGEAGIDPYTRAVSDVYQDLFGQGSFIGKGIYEVDAFERAVAGRFPENTVLSHDLLEACHARSGLVSDVELFEEYPARYNVDMDRRHRWMRGDWQLIPWLLPRVPGANQPAQANPLSGLSRWKISDNLRRSLVPVALLFFLLGHWFLRPELAVEASLLALAIIALPGLLTTVVTAVGKSRELPMQMHGLSVITTGIRQLGQTLLALAFLPYEAFVSLDAMSRTLVRMLVTRRRLLEWQTSSEVERTKPTSLRASYATMWFAPLVAILTGGLLVGLVPGIVPLVLPMLGLWFVAPGLAWWISRSIEPAKHDLSGEQLAFLRLTARRTWHFFETFVTAEEHWLPPDNFQEEPARRVATRTSPTNLGLALLANLAARDFGYLAASGLLRRTQATLATMQRLERHRGHFYNWYDTRTLQPMQPLYVSSVDSGNLAGHLLTLGAGLREQGREKIYSPEILAGIRDTVDVLRELLPGQVALTRLREACVETPATLPAVNQLFGRLTEQVTACEATMSNETEEVKDWLRVLRETIAEHRSDLLQLAPWVTLPDFPAASEHVPSVWDIAQNVVMVGQEIPPEWARARGDGAEQARQRLMLCEKLARQCDELAVMDFAFLIDPARDLFATGFNVPERRRDNSYYDLLASEARLASYVAISLGQVSQDHWFTLGRLLVAPQGELMLVSWSGSMFEYLMPLLVMPNHAGTLLDQTCRAAVGHQIKYGRLREVPWGISESGYHRTDAQLNYQYHAFGVPGLGLKRGLGEDVVIAPYATVMALMVAPEEACANLQRLAKEGRLGNYGFYEAVDYTPSRLPPGETSATVCSYMVHHEGMSLIALVNVLRDQPMPRRFMACPMLKAAELLLLERAPRTGASVLVEDNAVGKLHTLGQTNENPARVCTNPTPPAPEVHLLSNGNYHVVVTSAGGGYSRWHGLAVTRWREDSTSDSWGTFVYLRDVESGPAWSAAYLPTAQSVTSYEAVFTQDRAEFRHRRPDLDVHTEICVSPEDDVELRRVTLTNRTAARRVIELTSYAEVVLAPPAADVAHTAFSNLFVQTELLLPSFALLCTRRARSEDETPPWLVHLFLGPAGEAGEISCETDRTRFVGRGGSLANPAAMQSLAPLSNTVGSVLDPIVSLRRIVTVPPHETVSVVLVLGVSASRAGALVQAEKYLNARMVERAFDLAWTHNQVTLHQINATEGEAQLYGRLASALIYADPIRRANSEVLRANRRGQSGLWSHGISGDAPVVLLMISDADKIGLVRQLIQAHSYWRMKGLTVELIILNENVSIYRQSLHEQITSLISAGNEAQMLDRPGGIFVRRLEQISHEDRVLLQSVARVILDDERGTLAAQLERRRGFEPQVPALVAARAPVVEPAPPPVPRDLVFANGFGGFTSDGREYVITLQPGQMTPAPWVNVLANPTFGTVVSESGAAYTWVENAHEFRLTPWSNDPVRDPTGEALYIRDEQTGQYWSPTPHPARGTTSYVIRHGFGYTVFEHTENGLASELWVYVAMDAPVKFSVLKLRNVSGRARQVSVTGYWEWVLGEAREKSLLHVQTEVDPKTGALLARNHYNTEFPGRIAFLDINDGARTLTGDRKEFIGRNGNLAQPAALKRQRLSGKVGAGLDPCAAMQVTFELAMDQERILNFRLGVGRDPADVQNLISRFRRTNSNRAALEGVWSYWNRTLGSVNVATPDPAVNVMANGWLLYQTIGCRLWGRTGFYQSGGAYGFRDQLQDVMALVHAEPALVRQHLLRAAAHQFREGDVQHWWHPPAGRGVRTHFSDDYLWLPFVTCHYVATIADQGVLDEKIHFLEGRAVKPEEEAYYDQPNRSEETETLYVHCVRAIEHGLKFGVHGLPLIGCGDWNDGMNRVGHGGRGESVWLAFFLYDVLTRFSRLAQTRQDEPFAERCLTAATQLQLKIEAEAWDGAWYRRAFFDNGEPLGSQRNPECQIDSLPQSWSVISGAGEPDRARQAMQAMDERLVRRADQLIQLFDPPFDKSPLNPGYIKGYIPGVRENGGQYTHGAIWATMAFALMGENERAWELFTLLNPVNHGKTPAGIATYKVEPYVVAADVYGVAPHTGRGGWTWYTGSAGWMYRLLIETLLGVNREGDQLRLEPRLPSAWDTCKIHYRFRETVYHITFTRLMSDSNDERSLFLDGQLMAGATLTLMDDRREHEVEMKVR